MLKWKGALTSYQQEVSEGLIQAVKRGKHALVHAVTGAGKTEMMYQGYSNSYQGRKSSLYCHPKNRCLYRIVRKDEGRLFLPHHFASWRIGALF